MSDSLLFFFFNDTATTEIYTLSLHDALPILPAERQRSARPGPAVPGQPGDGAARDGLGGQHAVLPQPRRHVCHLWPEDRKSTRLNSSHANISYAVFCLKKKKLA